MVIRFTTPVKPVAFAIDIWMTPAEKVNRVPGGAVIVGGKVPGRKETSASIRAAPTVFPRVSRTTLTTAVSPILFTYVTRSVRTIGDVFDDATMTKIESLENSDSATIHASPA